MKARFGVALSMAVGAALGGAAIQALHAQANPPVYMVAINEVSDRKRIRFTRSEIGQRLRWGVCCGRTRIADCGEPTSRASCDPSLGKHGGATTLAQFSRISVCTKDWREIRDIQHRRG